MSANFICFNNDCFNMSYIKKFHFSDEKKCIDITVVNTETSKPNDTKNDKKYTFTFKNDELQYNSIKNKIRQSR